MILDLLFPNRCLQCNRIIGAQDLVCEICFSQIHFTHFDYHQDNALTERCRLLFPTVHAFALMQFEKESLSRKIIHTLKYGQREKAAIPLAKWTIERLDFKDEKPDLLVSIPLHQEKLRNRGYNQLHLFTEKLSKHYQIPFDHTVLKRTKNSKAQARKSRNERQNSEKKFVLNKEILGKHILLIDDVFTTGNTISDAVWELLKEPNNTISILVMAID